MIDFSGRLQGHAAPIPVASVVVLDYFMPRMCFVSSVFAILFMAVLFLDQPKNRTKANAISGAPSFFLYKMKEHLTLVPMQGRFQCMKICNL